MKILRFFLLTFAFFISEAQEIKVKDYFDKKPILNKDFSRKMKSGDSMRLEYDSGLFRQFTENSMYCINTEQPFINPHSQTEANYKLLKWNRSHCYNKDGELVKKKITFGTNTDNLQESYYLNAGKKIEKGSSIGDVLFTSSVDEILNMLENNGINPNILMSKTRIPRFLFRKLTTPSGEFWEFMEQSNTSSRIAVLIADKTKKVVAKTFDTSPLFTSSILTKEYDMKRYLLYFPVDFKFKMSQSEVLKVGSSLAGGEENIHFFPISKKLWILDYWKKDALNVGGVVLIINDETGEIILDSEEYSKDYIGEEKFIKEVNQLLLKYIKVH